MPTHMKTTVHIRDPLLREVQALVRKEGSTLKAAIDEGLGDYVAKRKRAAKPFVLKDASYPPANEVTELFEPRPWDEIRAVLYEDRGE
jgi:hypothetical protein